MAKFMQHKISLCCIFFMYCLLPNSMAEDSEEFVPKPRYERVLVKVPVMNSTLQARQKAIVTAHHNALKIWLESILSNVDDNTLDYFMARQDMYVLTSEVLKETKSGHRGEFQVEVYLDRDRIRYDAASYLFPGRAVPSSALIIMGQQFVENSYTTRLDDVGAAMLVKLFGDTGFLLKTQEEIDQLYSHEDLMACLRGGSDAVAKMARALKFDIAVMGEVRTGTVEEEDATGKIKAFVDIMIVRASDGLLLDRIQAEAIVSGNDSSIVSRVVAEDAMYKVQQRVLVAAALGILNDSPSRWTHCTIRGENVKRISNEVIQYLESKSVVDSLELQQRDRDAIILGLSYSGKLSELVDAFSEDAGDPYWLEAINVVGGGTMVFDLHVRE